MMKEITSSVVSSSTQLQRIISRNLPAMSGAPVTYNAAKNVFLTAGYTSAMGHTYYKALRVSNRLVVAYNIGEGAYNNAVFLNGITLFAWDGQKATIIAQKAWGGCNNYRFFTEMGAKQESICMLRDYLDGMAKLEGATINRNQLMDFARSMIEETQQKRLQ